MGAEGFFWVVGKGTARERRIPIRKGGSWTTTVALAEPPSSHQGKPLTKSDPLTVCELTLRYMEELVFEARSKFTSESVAVG